MPRKDFTKQQIKDYLVNPTKCPNCGGNILINIELFNKDDKTKQIECEDCPTKFEEIYELKTIKKLPNG